MVRNTQEQISLMFHFFLGGFLFSQRRLSNTPMIVSVLYIEQSCFAAAKEFKLAKFKIKKTIKTFNIFIFFSYSYHNLSFFQLILKHRPYLSHLGPFPQVLLHLWIYILRKDQIFLS